MSRELPRYKKEPWHVYFIVNRANARVKIGHSKTPRSRVHDLSLQAGIEFEVLAIIEETEAFNEFWAHLEVGALRIMGEWFELTPELLRWMDRLAIESGAEDAYGMARSLELRRVVYAEVEAHTKKSEVSYTPLPKGWPRLQKTQALT